MPPSDPYYWFVQIAIAHHLVSTAKDGFHPTSRCWSGRPTAPSCAYQRLNPKSDWSMLMALSPGKWEPNDGWKTGAPGYLPWEVAARQLGLRYDHPDDKLELFPKQAMPRGEMAYTLHAALNLSTWQIASLCSFDTVTLPPLSARQKQVVAFALDYVGYPYVWGGEWDGKDSPYGWQAHGGFDCSGFAVGAEDPLQVPDLGERARRLQHGPVGQAAHLAQTSQAGRHHLLRPARPFVAVEHDLPRRPIPGQRLVHPVHRVERRRLAGVARLAWLLEDLLRLGAPRAQEE